MKKHKKIKKKFNKLCNKMYKFLGKNPEYDHFGGYFQEFEEKTKDFNV